MKAGYKIEHTDHDGRQYTVVFNWEFSNTVSNYSFETKYKTLKYIIHESSLGVWQPKGTKEKQLK